MFYIAVLALLFDGSLPGIQSQSSKKVRHTLLRWAEEETSPSRRTEILRSVTAAYTKEESSSRIWTVFLTPDACMRAVALIEAAANSTIVLHALEHQPKKDQYAIDLLKVMRKSHTVQCGDFLSPRWILEETFLSS